MSFGHLIPPQDKNKQYIYRLDSGDLIKNLIKVN